MAHNRFADWDLVVYDADGYPRSADPDVPLPDEATLRRRHEMSAKDRERRGLPPSKLKLKTAPRPQAETAP